MARRSHANCAARVSPSIAGPADLDYPRWFHLLPNGDVLVSEARTVLLPSHDLQDPEIDGNIRARSLGPSANRITLLRDADGDGVAEFRSTFLEGLDRPFGMALLGDQFYVGATDGVFVFPYQSGQTALVGTGTKVLELPAGGYNNHWTRNVVVGPGGKKLYITVGSASNVGEYGGRRKNGAPASWRSTPTAATSESSPRACAIRSGSTGSRSPAPCGPPSTNATSWVTSSFPTT